MLTNWRWVYSQASKSWRSAPLIAALLGYIAVIFAANEAQAQCATISCVNSLTLIGILPGGGGFASTAQGVSTDGSVVVGSSEVNGHSGAHAFRWTSAGMVDLGTLGGTSSQANAVNADGAVVVGFSNITGNTGEHAFRWTSAGMIDLGTLGPSRLGSSAYGVSADGSVVVGESQIAGTGAQHAFRWTSAGMVDLGTLGGTQSQARAANADGAVVVGFSESVTSSNDHHAFRWTSAGMVDLGTLGGTQSQANAVNADGAVVVGSSIITGNTGTHAFRWTSAGMIDLGTLGGTNSSASGVSANGSVVVGISNITGEVAHAFRWTSPTGMQDLNKLLANAGVNMTGITLAYAWAVSGDGRFIVGDGSFPSGTQLAYVARYDGIAGMTNVNSVQTSINDLWRARLGAGVQQQGFAAPLLGADKPIDQTSEAGIFGSVGSAAAGAAGRYAFGGGLSVLGGLSFAKEDYENVELRNATTGALALRYSYAVGSWQPFIEGGGWIAPHASLTMSRTYANGAGTATGVGNTNGKISYVYGRAGMAVNLNKANQVAVSAEYGRESMRINGYDEALSVANPFGAHVAGGTDTFDMARLKAQYTLGVARHIDTTLWIAGVKSFNQSSGLSAFVDGFGTLTPSSLTNTIWAEFGARVGYKLTDDMTFDVFSGGIAGRDGVGVQVHSGVGLRVQF